MSTYHYDNQGNYKGKSESADGDGGLVVLGILLFVIWGAITWLWKQAVNYQDLEAPYNIVGAFYFFVVVTPIRLAGSINSFATTPGLTEWPNMNLLLGIILVLLYVAMIAAVTVGGVRMINTRYARIELAGVKALVVLLAAPGAFALLWFVLSAILRWLFATE